jgi:nitrate reductase molybdenum cofactor assembly chaperone NarJ/NarW
MKTYKVLSALLDYPTEDLVAAVPDLRAALEAERALPPAVIQRLEPLLAEFTSDDLFELQERYIGLFDRVRTLSLHLFEHVHGDSRDRGQALVDLAQLYERHGFALSTSELPDYLPAFLEFLSRIEATEAAKLLAEAAHLLQSMSARLEKRRSRYTAVFDALLVLSGAQAGAPVVVTDEDIRKEDDPATVDALWEEQPAFGPAPECGGATRGSVSVVQFQKRAA